MCDLFTRSGRSVARRPDTVESIQESVLDSRRAPNFPNEPEKLMPPGIAIGFILTVCSFIGGLLPVQRLTAVFHIVFLQIT